MMRCGLLGRTLGHSYSPAIHKTLGGAYTYELFEVEPENLPGFLARKDWDGLNVTIPYKQAVIPFCQSLSPDASAIGSVNTILRRADDSHCGDNTDARGFLYMLQGLGVWVTGKKVLVLGSGGSSRTVCHVLREGSVGEVIVISREGTHTYETLDRHTDAQILVNTTPVGMYPETGKAPVDLARFPRLEAVLDLIYNPARTCLLQDAEARGIPHIGGLPMLVGQAAAAASIFSGKVITAEKETQALSLIRRQMENLIFVGMPGSGKSTIGQLAAAHMGRPFVDADQAIEEAAGYTIPEIFAREGEAGFRCRETKILETLGRQSGLVIATGGGAVTRPENYPHLHQNGVILWLERDLAALAREGRPLSQSADLQAMYQARRPYYQRFADRTVQNAGAPEAVAQTALEVFMKHLGH